MTTIIVCFVAGISITAFFTLWFVVVYREFAGKKRVLDNLAEQVQMHHTLRETAKTDTAREEAARMLKTSMMIYNEAVKGYNRLLRHPFYCFPGFLMGFRKAGQMEEK